MSPRHLLNVLLFSQFINNSLMHNPIPDPLHKTCANNLICNGLLRLRVPSIPFPTEAV